MTFDELQAVSDAEVDEYVSGVRRMPKEYVTDNSFNGPRKHHGMVIKALSSRRERDWRTRSFPGCITQEKAPHTTGFAVEIDIFTFIRNVTVNVLIYQRRGQ